MNPNLNLGAVRFLEDVKRIELWLSWNFVLYRGSLACCCAGLNL